MNNEEFVTKLIDELYYPNTVDRIFKKDAFKDILLKALNDRQPYWEARGAANVNRRETRYDEEKLARGF